MAPARRAVDGQDAIKTRGFQEGGFEGHQPLGRLQVVVKGRLVDRLVPVPGRGDGGGGGGRGCADGRSHGDEWLVAGHLCK